MARVFISYSRNDRSLAAELAAAIQDYGHEVWWDDALVGGQDFRDVIEEKLSLVDAIIVMWTESSVQKVWVKAEARLGLDRGILVPVRFLTSLIPPDEFSHLHAEDLSGWNRAKRAPQIDKLIHRVDDLKSQGDKDRLGSMLGPELRARVQNSSALHVIFDSALPGGLRISRFLLGALATSAGLWATLSATNAAIGDPGHAVGLGSFVLLVLALGLSRGFDQLILASKGRSSDRFFDRSFAAASSICVLLGSGAGLLLVLVQAVGGGGPDVNAAIQFAVLIACLLLTLSYFLRALASAAKVLQSRV